MVITGNRVTAFCFPHTLSFRSSRRRTCEIYDRRTSQRATMNSPTNSAQLWFSINGPDNIGKTTQVGMIPSRWGIQKMKGIHEYNDRLSTLVKREALKEWWFGTDDEDFVNTIRTALENRRQCATQSSYPAMFDRGATMFKAIGVDLISAEDIFKKLTKGMDSEWPVENHAILIRHEGTLEETVECALGKEHDPDDQYRGYQGFLHQMLERQATNGSYSAIISRTGKNCLEVHNEICEWIRNVGAPKSWSPLLASVSCIVGFGGLSEAGKSTVATATAAHFGEKGMRLKIIYFMDLASRELKRSVYDLPDDQQAFCLIQEIDRFASAHKWVQVICIDSLHRFGSSQTLRDVLEGKTKLVYIDTKASVRFSRVDISKEEFVAKDETKITRGADRIKGIAHIVVDNNGLFEDTVARVTGAVQAVVGLPDAQP